MEKQRNSECWYISTCQDDCDKCTVYLSMKYQMDNSGLFKSQQRPITLYIGEGNTVDRESYKRLAEIRKNIVDYVEAGNNLFICGRNPGNGKTSWAIKMLQTYFHYTAQGNYDNLKGMFVSTVDLLLKLKDFNNPLPKKYKDNLEQVDLVVFDDIAITDTLSSYDYTQLFNIINNRVAAEKSTIFTSNKVTYDELTSVLGHRLASRVYSTSEIIELKGVGMR